MKFKEVNIDKIRAKVRDIKESLDILHKYAEDDEDEFIANQEAVRAARYSFIIIIEASMNIANHICARVLNKAPENYAETFILLGEGKIIDVKLATKLAQMAKFRNLLVHGYAKVDDRRVFKMIRDELADVDDFLEAIKKNL